jgi:peroxiredoxin
LKKAIIIVILAGMLGYTIYHFTADSGDPDLKDMAQQTADNTIISPPKDGETPSLSDGEGLDKGDKAPDFELTTLDGEKVKLSDYKGEKVLLNFWATWCPPCRAEMPDMQKLHDKHDDVNILAVNLSGTESGEEKIRDFIDELDLSFTIPLDTEMEISQMYEVVAYPTTYMIDSDGRIGYKSFGALNYELMKKELAKLD